MPSKKLRLDMLLVEKGYFPSRAKAQAALMAGQVQVAGCIMPKAGMLVQEDVGIEVLANAVPFVSRGGLKLAAALDAFDIRVEGKIAIDLGASTGGFTDCLLQHGAKKVYAVDVGHGQLDFKLRADARVLCLERMHARMLKPELFKQNPPNLATIDVSFISLSKVLPYVLPCLKNPYDIVALIKPQFELEPRKTPKGVVRKEQYRQEALAALRQFARELPVVERGLISSPLRGPKGNLEFLWHLAGAREV